MSPRRAVLVPLTIAFGLLASPAVADEPDVPIAVAAPAPPPPPSGQTATVTVESDRAGTVLLQDHGTTVVFQNVNGAEVSTTVRNWRPVCTAPCTATVDAAAAYRIGGRGVVASDELRLPAGPSARLVVNAGSPDTRRWGSFFLSTGILAALVGGAFVISGFVSDPDYTEAKYFNEPNHFREDDDRAYGYRLGGAVTVGVGVVMAIVGGIMRGASGTEVLAGAPAAR